MELSLLLFGTVPLLSSLVRITSCDRPTTYIRILSAKKLRMSSHIVGGIPVDIEQFPYACIVFNVDSMCGGTIISSWAVLTAAHCFDVYDDVKEITVHAGSRHRWGENAETYYAVHLEKHKDYNSKLFVNDIAMIFVDLAIKFGKNVQRAILTKNDKWLRPEVLHNNRSDFTVIGWGKVSNDGPISQLGLLMSRMQLVSLPECAKYHEGTENAVFTSEMFCLYGDGKHDSCGGDSGTGVFWHEQLVGVVSHGDGCAGKDKPSVYVNVHHFYDWIKYTVEKYHKTFCRETQNWINN